MRRLSSFKAPDRDPEPAGAYRNRPQRIAERQREKEVIKRRIATLLPIIP